MLNENTFLYKVFNMPHLLIQARRNRFLISVSIFFFIWFFLFIFGVFNFDTYSTGDRLMRTFVYALSSFGTTLFNFLVLQDLFLKKYNFKEIILWSLWLTSTVGTANFLISVFIFYRYEATWLFWLYNQVYVFSVFLFFFPSILLLNYLVNLRKQLQQINEQSEKIKYHQSETSGKGDITILSRYKSDHFKIAASKILYLTSAGNYVEIHFFQGQKIEQHLLRNTLSALEKQKLDPSLVRCHRSYIVNIKQVDFIKKLQGKDFLILANGLARVPLSKSFKNLIEGLISKRD